jgi:hypothetical protein
MSFQTVHHQVASAFIAKAGMCSANRNIRFGPKADIAITRSPHWQTPGVCPVR